MINLKDYSPPIVRFIRRNDFAAIFVFSIDGHAPVKIGHALNLRHRYGLVTEAHPEPIGIELLIWTPSVATAALIAEDIRHKLGVSEGRPGGWWNVAPAVAVEVVRRACAAFPSRNLLEHNAFLAMASAAGFAVPAARRFA